MFSHTIQNYAGIAAAGAGGRSDAALRAVGAVSCGVERAAFLCRGSTGWGQRSCSWVKSRLRGSGWVKEEKGRGKHRKRRLPAACPGMMLQQDGSRHRWVAGQCRDRIVRMDDATHEHYSMFFVDEEGTASRFQGVREVIETGGVVFCSLSTDRGSHGCYTGQAGGKVDKRDLTQFGRAMRQLGIEMIPVYSPQARGRSERAFETHQDRWVKELALAGISDRQGGQPVSS